MASVGTPQGAGGRRKSLDAEINLVPFIDLLSMCICFLLMTAVWVQIGALEVKQSHGTDTAPPTAPLDVEAKFTSPASLEIVMKRGGKAAKKLIVSGKDNDDLVTQLDSGLDGMLFSAAGIKQPKGDAGTLVSAVMLTPKTGVTYSEMVAVMDVFRKHRIVNLGVVPVGGS